MSSILDKMIEQLKTNNLTEQVRSLCDKIYEEEKDKQIYRKLLPKGATKFLELQVPGRNEREVGFLALEREDENKYIIVYSTISKTVAEESLNSIVTTGISPKRIKVWVVVDTNPTKILTNYAQKVKLLRGE